MKANQSWIVRNWVLNDFVIFCILDCSIYDACQSRRYFFFFIYATCSLKTLAIMALRNSLSFVPFVFSYLSPKPCSGIRLFRRLRIFSSVPPSWGYLISKSFFLIMFTTIYHIIKKHIRHLYSTHFKGVLQM